MGRVTKAARAQKRRALKARQCVYLTHQNYARHEAAVARLHTRGFGVLRWEYCADEEWMSGSAVVRALERAMPFPKDFALVLAPAHGNPSGDTQCVPEKPEPPYSLYVKAHVVLAAALPLLPDGARIHFHTCQMGLAFAGILRRLNRMESVKIELRGVCKSWRVSGYMQTIPEWDEAEDGTLRTSSADRYVFEGLLGSMAPPGVVRVATLMWDGSRFSLAQSTVLGGVAKNTRN